jgi:hypothetical protein
MKSMFAAAMLASAGAAAAQPAPPPSDEIVVEGEALKTAELEERASAMIRTLALLPTSDQYARWNAPVCPTVIGTPNARVIEALTDKLRLVAAEAGVPLGKPGCDSNLVIAFADDAGRLFSKVAARRTQIFETVLPREARTLRRSALPVRWWFGLQTGGAEGQGVASAAEAPGGTGLPTLDLGQSSIAVYGGGSLIDKPVRTNVMNAAILIDVRRVEGVRLDALAAYVAMMALAPARLPPAPVPVRSIANLFLGQSETTDLTAWDRAYLEALYRTPPNRAARAQNTAMAVRMAERIGGAN